MTSSMGSLGPKADSPRDCLLQLDTLVPKTSEAFSKLTVSEKTALALKVTEILGKVLNNPQSFEAEQQNNLMNISDLAKKAEKLGLVDSSQDVMLKIAATAKEKGLSLYTDAAPHDLTIMTSNGEIKVNSDILKENSEVFKNMFLRGMKEQKENTLQLNNYSKETVEFLMRGLNAPSASPIDIPQDAAILELIDLAMTYQLDKFIPTLESAVSRFIAAQPQTVLENTKAWMNLLLNQKDQKYSATVVKWIADLTPHFLNNFDIPVKPSEVPGKFEIPIAQIGCLFNKNTRGLFQHLPLVLEIKNAQDLAIFENACKNFKDNDRLSIKLLCKQGLSADEEARLQNITRASNIEISLEKLPIPPGTVLFGKEEWETYFGPIGEAPPIPAGIAEVLRAPCPYFPGKTYKDTFMLVLIPASVSGKPLHLNNLHELIQNPKGGGHGTKYDLVHQPTLNEYGNIAPQRSYWALMSMQELPNSRNRSYQEQQALVAANPSYEVPDLLCATVCILTHFVRTGVRLFSREPWTYTRCQETALIGQNRYPTVVGGLGAPGLHISSHNFDRSYVAVAAIRKFF